MDVRIRVNGIDQCIQFGDLVSTNVLRAIEKEVDEGAKAIRQRERSLAPRKTGALQNSIVARKGRYGISKMVRAKAPHAPLQEYGTRRGVKAKYFAQKTREQLLPEIEQKLRAAIDREVRR